MKRFYSTYKKEILLGLLILAISLSTRFVFWGYPAEVVFDEVYFGKYATNYQTGEYYYNLHPPLGAELISLGGWLGGYRGELSFEKIGDPYESDTFKALRLWPAIAGSLIPLATYILAIYLGASTVTAFIVGFVLSFDNALVVQSRFMMPDVFLILFAIAGFGIFLYARKHDYKTLPMFFCAVFLSMSFSVKWSAAGLIIAVLILAGKDALDALKNIKNTITLKNILRGLALMAGVFIVVYPATFYIHLRLLTLDGPGNAFMTDEFLLGEKSFPAQFWELSTANYKGNMIDSVAPHEDQSKFYTWPLMHKPVFYWQKINAENVGRIYLLGNPIIWWGALLGVIGGIFFWRPKNRETKNILYLAFISSLAPFVFVERTLFLYHYLPSLVFAVLIAVFWLTESLESPTKNTAIKLAAVVTIVLAGFIFLSPLTYGIPQNETQFESRIMFDNWK